jgi:carbon monoxide dehydrogenase subunit G
MRIEQKIEIGVPPAAVWGYVTDPDNYCEFMEGVTRWDVAGNRAQGLGARYRMLIHIGSADVGGLIEVVEWKPARNMAWSSVTGVDQRGRWLLRETGDGRTRVTFRFAYGVAGGGITGMIAERVAARPLRRRFRQALLNLKRTLEGQRFAEEAERRTKVAT